MPFTPTHVLAILPIAAIRRLRLPFSGLVMGSMIPDLPLFVSLPVSYATTHSVPGLVTACLPLGLASFLAFQLVMKRPLFTLLPAAIQARCAGLAAPCARPTPAFAASAALAVVIGAATHVVWDAFTHKGRWGTRLWPALNETALTIQGRALPGFKLLQYGSTVIGLPLLVVLAAAWLAQRKPESLPTAPTVPLRWKLAAYAAAMMLPVCAAALVWLRDDAPPYERLGRSITTAGVVLTTAVLLWGAGFRLTENAFARYNARRPPDARHPDHRALGPAGRGSRRC